MFTSIKNKLTSLSAETYLFFACLFPTGIISLFYLLPLSLKNYGTEKYIGAIQHPYFIIVFTILALVIGYWSTLKWLSKINCYKLKEQLIDLSYAILISAIVDLICYLLNKYCFTVTEYWNGYFVALIVLSFFYIRDEITKD